MNNLDYKKIILLITLSTNLFAPEIETQTMPETCEISTQTEPIACEISTQTEPIAYEEEENELTKAIESAALQLYVTCYTYYIRLKESTPCVLLTKKSMYMIENIKNKKITVEVPSDFYKKVKLQCATDGITLKNLIIDSIKLTYKNITGK